MDVRPGKYAVARFKGGPGVFKGAYDFMYGDWLPRCGWQPDDAPAFQEAVGTLYSVAYTLKFMFKKERAIDYPVMALEGLWSAEDMADFAAGRRDRWQWTLLIVQPDVVTAADVGETIETVKAKGKLPRIPDVRLEKLREGRAAQILHIGPYSAEGPTIERLHRFVEEQGLRLRGRHHEIYMGDPRRAAPEKLKTIIRHPVA
jgi:hypothetical protein